jgi:hypothetical protein
MVLRVEAAVLITVAGDFVTARGDFTDEDRGGGAGATDGEEGSLATAIVEEIEQTIDYRDEAAARVIAVEMVLEIEGKEDFRF